MALGAGPLIPGLTNIRVATRFLPPIDIDMTDDSSGSASAWQPAVVATVGGQPLTWAPFGDPGPQWAAFAAAVIGLIAIGGAYVARGMR